MFKLRQGKVGGIRFALRCDLAPPGIEFPHKPWIISPEDLPKLQAALDTADANRVIAYDIMTERYEITSIIQRELVNDPDIFGDICVGTEDEPGVFMESVHYLIKTVAGVPLRRPAWFFCCG